MFNAISAAAHDSNVTVVTVCFVADLDLCCFACAGSQVISATSFSISRHNGIIFSLTVLPCSATSGSRAVLGDKSLPFVLTRGLWPRPTDQVIGKHVHC